MQQKMIRSGAKNECDFYSLAATLGVLPMLSKRIIMLPCQVYSSDDHRVNDFLSPHSCIQAIHATLWHRVNDFLSPHSCMQAIHATLWHRPNSSKHAQILFILPGKILYDPWCKNN